MSESELLDVLARHLDLRERMLGDQLEAWLQDQAAEWMETRLVVLREDMSRLLRELYRSGEASEG